MLRRPRKRPFKASEGGRAPLARDPGSPAASGVSAFSMSVPCPLWIPGLALLARNDEGLGLFQSIEEFVIPDLIRDPESVRRRLQGPTLRPLLGPDFRRGRGVEVGPTGKKIETCHPGRSKAEPGSRAGDGGEPASLTRFRVSFHSPGMTGCGGFFKTIKISLSQRKLGPRDRRVPSSGEGALSSPGS
jgi:hypothetical protein